MKSGGGEVYFQFPQSTIFLVVSLFLCFCLRFVHLEPFLNSVGRTCAFFEVPIESFILNAYLYSFFLGTCQDLPGQESPFYLAIPEVCRTLGNKKKNKTKRFLSQKAHHSMYPPLSLHRSFILRSPETQHFMFLSKAFSILSAIRCPNFQNKNSEDTEMLQRCRDLQQNVNL